jgi:poly(3-hydroxyalkanoate) synthetase
MNNNHTKKVDLAKKLSDIANNVAKKPVFVVSPNNGVFDILNYYTRIPVIQEVPSKSLAVYMCESLNKKKTVPTKPLQKYVNIYAKHYYDCEFYKHTIKTTKDNFKRDVTINRLDISIEYLKQAASYIRKSC